jgi:uncharacterized membrane protein
MNAVTEVSIIFAVTLVICFGIGILVYTVYKLINIKKRMENHYGKENIKNTEKEKVG